MNDVTRRTLVRGTAWSVPAVAASAAAPAHARSTVPCEPVTAIVDWESAQFTRVSATQAYYEIPLSDGTTIRMDINSTFSQMNSGDAWTRVNDNLALSEFNIGGTGQPGLVLHQNNWYHWNTYGHQDVTFTFDRPIASIDFAVTDIDASRGDFVDAVSISDNLVTTPNPGIGPRPYNGRTHYLPDKFVLYDNASGGNNLKAHGENITKFTIRYSNFDQEWQYATGKKQDRDQRVFLTDFKLTVPPTDC